MPEKLKPGLTAEHVIHPLDRQGLQAVVDKAAGLLGRSMFDRLMREADEDFYLLNLADNTKLGPAQGASVYALVADVADTLGLPTPHVFLDTSPEFKARTMGGAHASLVLPSGLLDALDDGPLRAVIGHELGYILCGHSFYKLLAENFNRLTATVRNDPVGRADPVRRVSVGPPRLVQEGRPVGRPSRPARHSGPGRNSAVPALGGRWGVARRARADRGRACATSTPRAC